VRSTSNQRVDDAEQQSRSDERTEAADLDPRHDPRREPQAERNDREVKDDAGHEPPF
jgi:hypothetical protein